ncbi:MAG TPA: GAP family protein [Gaiellaceae bacterium]|nr:GAP family protein [Gaiellaceae bacterium]
MGKAFLFAFTAALNPTLLTATTVMLLLPSPKRLMLGYLAGAFTTGMVVGIAIVEWMSDSGVVSSTKHTLAPSLDFAFGVIALLAAYVVQSGRVARARARRAEKRSDKPKKPPRWQEALSGGSARTTFVIGLLLSFPGASYLASLTEISRQNLGTVEVVLAVLAVNIVMLALLEVPLVCFALAPEWTPLAIERFKGWLAVHGGKVLVIALTAIGCIFILRGVLTIVS